MARRMRKRFGETPAEALLGDPCGSTLARCLRTRSGAAPTEAL